MNISIYLLFQGDYIWIEPVSRREFDVAIGARVVTAEGRRIQVRHYITKRSRKNKQMAVPLKRRVGLKGRPLSEKNFEKILYRKFFCESEK